MSIPKKLKNYLRKHNIDYRVVAHKTAYTAYDLAQTTKEKLKNVAKSVALKADRKYAVVVVPASHRLDLAKLKKALNASTLSIVKEVELARVFKVKPGAIVPFATFHKVPVYVDRTLLKSRVVLISGGSYTASLKVKTRTLVERGGELLAAVSKKYLSDSKEQKQRRSRRKRV
jgi:Ala-tRNA(Pro) deacylase